MLKWCNACIRYNKQQHLNITEIIMSEDVMRLCENRLLDGVTPV